MEEIKIASRDPEVTDGELVFWGTRVEVETLVNYPRAGHTLDDFLEGFPRVSRQQAEVYLDMTLEAARQEAPRAAGASRR